MFAASAEDELFHAARRLAGPQERATFLLAACEANEPLRLRLEALLAAHDVHDNPLDRPPAEFAAAVRAVALTRCEPSVGDKVGVYTLLQRLGEGGMGSVWAAEQHIPVHRRVALKLIKPGMDSQQVLRRFEAERQALALMDHPNIARVFDAGATASDRPFFVMELVQGIPITEHCDQRQLSLKERLGLFVSVCQAVQHAHQKGIIHRDLKPSNVLVTEYDAEAVPKVIDFGVAKATDGMLAEDTLFTQQGQLVGTLEYMSPEQSHFNQPDIDTRSDVYSLGVLLYELVTGSTPFARKRLNEAALDETLRIIREEDPPKPSARLSKSEELLTIAAHRGGSSHALLSAAQGELDWITMRCLEKDRSRRYESAASLAADVKRFLADEPVQACPPTVLYRLQKLARRYKAAVIGASAVALAALAAVAALAISTALVWQANGELTESFEREQQEANFHRITLAHRDLSIGNLDQALKLLVACPEELRGWEWRYLMRLCRVEPLILRDATGINGLAFSPDGERIASAGSDGTVKIWNSRTGEVVQAFPAHTDSVVSVTFHPAGNHLASCGADQQVKVWDLRRTGEDQEVFADRCDTFRKFGTAYTVAFRPPEGRQLAVGSDGSVRLWDWRSHELVHDFPGHDQHPISVAFSSDGRRLAAGAWQEGEKLWDAEGGELQPIRTFPAHPHPVSALAFSPDGDRLASASFDRSVKLWETATGRLVHTLPHTGNVLCAAFSADGSRLASGGEDKTVRIWDATTGREVLSLRGHTGMCGCVAFSPDGQRLASASTDKTIRVWDASPLIGNERQELLTFTGHTDEVRSVAFSPDGQSVASAGLDTDVKIWDVKTGKTRTTFDVHADVVFCLAWQPNGQRLASCSSDGPLNTVRVSDALDGRQLFSLPPGRECFAVAFSPDGRHLVTGRGNGAVQSWDAENAREVETLGNHLREVRGVVFSPDGKHLASASSDGIVKLWDAARLDQKREARDVIDRVRVPGPTLNVAFSPDSRRMATGGEENTVIIWDVQTCRELQTLRGHNGDVYAIAFSPNDDGRLIASAGEDSAVKIWDSHTGTLVRNFLGHTGLVSSVAFSTDGQLLVSGSRDKTVKVWEMSRLKTSEHAH